MKKSRVKSFLTALCIAGMMGVAAPSIGAPPSTEREYRYIGHSGVSEMPAVVENLDTESFWIIAIAELLFK